MISLSEHWYIEAVGVGSFFMAFLELSRGRGGRAGLYALLGVITFLIYMQVSDNPFDGHPPAQRPDYEDV